MEKQALSSIPSVDRVLREVGANHLPRAVVVALIRRELAEIREGRATMPHDQVLGHVRKAMEDLRRTRIQAVINGTGIIFHTNFCRAPLGPKVVEAMAAVAASYHNLEYDLEPGERGTRGGAVD